MYNHSSFPFFGDQIQTYSAYCQGVQRGTGRYAWLTAGQLAFWWILPSTRVGEALIAYS